MCFKDRNFSMGILEGVRGMEAMARGLQLPKPEAPWWFLPLLIGAGIFVILLVYNLFKSGKTGWAWAVICIGVAGCMGLVARGSILSCTWRCNV